MFISRHVYDSLRKEAVMATADAHAHRTVNTQLTVHLEWMRARLVQVETERAQLIKRYLGVDIPVPSFEPTETPQDLNQTIDFRDMGDVEAAKHGISWDDDGVVKYSSPGQK